VELASAKHQLTAIDRQGPSYAFAANQPTDSIDILGLDRWYCVVGLHAYVLLDKWDDCCNKIGQVKIEFFPSSNWYEILSLSGAVVPGQVAIYGYTSKGWARRHKTTSCEQDKQTLAYATSLQQNPPMYQISNQWGGINCFLFAGIMYESYTGNAPNSPSPQAPSH
jgi:hypothetical protein